MEKNPNLQTSTLALLAQPDAAGELRASACAGQDVVADTGPSGPARQIFSPSKWKQLLTAGTRSNRGPVALRLLGRGAMCQGIACRDDSMCLESAHGSREPVIAYGNGNHLLPAACY